MRYRSLLFLIAILAVISAAQDSQTTISESACPELSQLLCDSTGSIGCIEFLRPYSRTYDVANSTCPCATGFVEMQPVNQYCCPSNCTICSGEGGCVSCKQRWELQETSSGTGVCVCPYNYYYDGNDCYCLNRIKPTQYYWVESEETCYQCPPGCICNNNGCVSCDNSTQRVVITVYSNQLSTNACPCLPPYGSTQENICVCPQNCDCTNGNISCNSFSHRVFSQFNIWICQYAYIQFNVTCVCSFPFNETDVLSQYSDCVCGSLFVPTQIYYSIEHQCIVCPQDCICNSIGCMSCTFYTYRQIVGNTCPCYFPYREVFGVCQCYDPYYINATGACIGMDEVFPTRYYSIVRYLDGSIQCHRCPQGCQCNETAGCFYCSPESIRVVQIFYADDSIGIKYYSCISCDGSAVQENGICRCLDGGTPNSQGQCNCSGAINFWQDSQLGSCASCPQGCKCNDILGCYYCQNYTLRDIVPEGDVESRCQCILGAFENTLKGICICSHGIDPSNSTQCLCPYPYISFADLNECICQSHIDPSSFYQDEITGQCFECPAGCQCDYNGCNYCESNALRFVYTYTNSYYYYNMCPCLQTTSLLNQSCTICPNHQYYFNGFCINCWQCMTCDWKGRCLTCNHTVMNLVNHTCQCIQPTHTNIKGTCRCPLTQYSQGQNSSCQACPVYCMDCKYKSITTPQGQLQYYVKCLVCLDAVHRIDNAEEDCPCQEGYAEAIPAMMSYCCDVRCYTCNQTGCLSCLNDLYRQLNDNQQCACIGNLVEQLGVLTCGCPDGQYLYLLLCKTCPLRCRLCQYNEINETVDCIVCADNSNRDITTNDCVCLENYIEASPEGYYCYPEHCARVQLNCTACQDDREPIQNGTRCACKETFFENSYGICESCQMGGCMNCTSVTFCLLCNESQGYFLTESSCKYKFNETNYLYLQNVNGIIIQFTTDIDMNAYPQFYNINGSLQQIYPNLTQESPFVQPVNIATREYSVDEHIITVRFSHPETQFNNSLLAIGYAFKESLSVVSADWYGQDSQGTYAANDSIVYIKLSRVYAQSTIEFHNRGFVKIQLALTIVVLLLLISLYIKGFKHNQTIFFLQTMAFLSFTIQDPHLDKTQYLYGLRFSYLNFGNILSGVIPKNYIEQSKGNFAYFTKDSNLIRVAGTTLAIAIVTAAIIISLRIFCYIFVYTVQRQNKLASLIIKSNKKGYYRLLEFLYKTCMYPLIFFSIITFNNWNPRVFIPHPYFLDICHVLVIVTFVSYIMVTIFQIWFQTVALINRIENATEFFCNYAAAAIIALNIFNNRYLLLLFVFALRGGSYIILRRSILRDFRANEYIKVISTLLEMITILLTLTNSTTAIMSFIVITVICQLVHTCAIVFLTHHQAAFQNCQVIEGSIDGISTVKTQAPSLIL